MTELVAMVDDARIRPAVDKAFSLDDAASAMDYLLSGQVRGKVAVSSPPERCAVRQPRSMARRVSMVSASAGVLSGRYRTTRANRSATPPGYRVLRCTPSKAISTTSSGRRYTVCRSWWASWRGNSSVSARRAVRR